MDFNKNFKKEPWFAYTVAACSAVVLYVLLTNIPHFWNGIISLLNLISPIFTGIIIAYILNPLLKVYNSWLSEKIKNEAMLNSLSVFLTVITFILGLVFLCIALIPQIVDSLSTFIANIDTYAATTQTLFADLKELAANFNIDISKLTDSVSNALTNFSSNVTTHMGTLLNTSFSIGKSFFNLIIGFILAIYFLGAKHNLLNAFKRLFRIILKDKQYVSFMAFSKRCNNILARYIGFDILDGIIVAIINAIFMGIAGIPYSILISVIVGITNLAPTFGPIIGGGIGAFILVLINPWYAVWFLIFTVILQTVDGYVIKPKLFGETLGVPGVWILISLVIGGRLFGVMGILLAIPFAAIVDFLYHDLMTYLQNKKTDESKKTSDNDDLPSKNENNNDNK
ncbi:MAG: AI-2E family transporter [Butyrivibrio sp.]|nr:AI-2E family transporter [Butyrivibrio sp.]